MFILFVCLWSYAAQDTLHKIRSVAVQLHKQHLLLLLLFCATQEVPKNKSSELGTVSFCFPVFPSLPPCSSSFFLASSFSILFLLAPLCFFFLPVFFSSSSFSSVFLLLLLLLLFVSYLPPTNPTPPSLHRQSSRDFERLELERGSSSCGCGAGAGVARARAGPTRP